MECPRRGCARWKALKTRATHPPSCWQSRLAPLDNARYCTSTMQVLYSPVSPFSTGEKTHCFVSLLAFASFQTLLILFTRPSLSPATRIRFRRRRKRKEKEGERERRERDDLLNEGGNKDRIHHYWTVYFCHSIDSELKLIFPLFRHRYGIIEVRRDKVSFPFIDPSFRFLYEIARVYGSRRVFYSIIAIFVALLS